MRLPFLARRPVVRPLDCHCHLLPGLDDGARDLPEALAMAAALAGAGVVEVVATPHVSSDQFPLGRARIEQACASLRDALRAAGSPLLVRPGAEYYLEPALLPRLEGEGLLGWDGRVLVELPLQPRLAPATLALLERLRAAGHRPVVAHAERVPAFHASREEALRLRESGVELQVNYSAFGRRGPERELARWLLDRGAIDAWGSDLHRAPAGGDLFARRATGGGR